MPLLVQLCVCRNAALYCICFASPCRGSTKDTLLCATTALRGCGHATLLLPVPGSAMSSQVRVPLRNGVGTYEALAMPRPRVGQYELALSVPRLGLVAVVVSVVAGPPDHLYVLQQPFPITDGTAPLKEQPVVTLQDAANNTVCAPCPLLQPCCSKLRSVMVRSVHDNIVLHIGTPCCLF